MKSRIIQGLTRLLSQLSPARARNQEPEDSRAGSEHNDAESKQTASYVEIDGTDLPRRLKELREKQRLSQADLADASGLTYRTIHDLEAGRRRRVLEKTVMLLASALGVRLEELLERYENGADTIRVSRWRPRVALATLTAFVLVAAAGMVRSAATRNATWDRTDRGIVAYDGYLGIATWSLDLECEKVLVAIAPWSQNELVVGVSKCTGRSENILCIDRSSGKILWEGGPDVRALVAAFGPDDIYAGKMQYKKMRTADLDADGEPELIAEFHHSLYYPYAICRFDRNGRLIDQYANKGHLYDSAVLDIDGDGKDEYIGIGVNNSSAFQGPTFILLDDKHFSGASVDSLTNSWSSEPDSALIRLVIPRFPPRFQEMMADSRLGAFELEVYTGPAGTPRIRAAIGGARFPLNRIFVVLDHELRPIQTEIKDSFAEYINRVWPDSLKNGTGPTDPAWRDQWMAKAVRFEAGHWPSNR